MPDKRFYSLNLSDVFIKQLGNAFKTIAHIYRPNLTKIKENVQMYMIN